MRRPASEVDIEAKPAARAGLAALVREAADRTAGMHHRGAASAQEAFRAVRRDLMGLAVELAAEGREFGDAGLGVPGARTRRACAGAIGQALRAARQDGDLCWALGTIYESLLALHPSFDRTGRLVLREARVHSRKTSGSYYTPAVVVEHLLDTALDPVLAKAGPEGARRVRVCDPACGCGNFLIAAARRIARASGKPSALARVLRSCIYGMDIDPLAAAVCRAALRLEADLAEEAGVALEGSIRTGDALRADWPALFPSVFAAGGFDVVVGNPPYLNQLARETTTDRRAATALKLRFPGAVGAYTDPGALFLLAASQITRPGGRVSLVLPQSVLATRDAEGVRTGVLKRGTIESLWIARERVFDAGVMVCAPTIRIGGRRPRRVVRFVGPGFEPAGAAVPDGDGSWASLAAVDVPDVVVRTTGTLGDIATATADFRDQYYGLRGCVVEDSGDEGVQRGPPLVTTGLIDAACCRWGARQTRFDGRVWDAPRVDLGRLRRTTRLGPWAAARLVPKVLLATQTRVLEAAIDERGEWIPAVPVITIVPRRPADLWRIAAVLLSPVASAWAARHHGGAGLSFGAIKLSAKQAMRVPLPRRGGAWDAAARLVSRAMRTGEDAARAVLLREAAGRMATAYGVRALAGARLLAWWESAAGPARGRRIVAPVAEK